MNAKTMTLSVVSMRLPTIMAALPLAWPPVPRVGASSGRPPPAAAG
jgi:hypothetical protein